METQEANDDGGHSGGGMASESQRAVAKPTGTRIDKSYGVPPFLIKLYNMVNDKTTDSIVSWGSSSTTFIILDEQRLISEILPCYFRSNRLDSFICQLNNYGFKKTEWNGLEFGHKHFQEGKPHLLKTIKRKKQHSKFINNTTSFGIHISELKTTYDKINVGQKQIKNKIQHLKDDFEETLSEVENVIETMTHELISIVPECTGQKRKFLHNGHSIDFANTEKDFQPIYDKLEVSERDDFMTLSELKETVATRHDGRGGGCGTARRVPQFLHKLYDMVENEETNHLVSWKLPYRDSFVIPDINKFSVDVLPKYFTHTNFNSFHSQLNIYGFRKITWEHNEYANEWFIGGRYDLLTNINRRDKILHLMGSITTCSSTELESFKNLFETIQQEQENKIIWLSNYEEQMKNSVKEFKEMVLDMASIVMEMISKSSEKLENVKKVKLNIRDDVTGDEKGNEKGQESEVDEVGDIYNASTENNDIQLQHMFQELGFNPDLLEKIIMEMKDDLIEMDIYLPLFLGNSGDIDEKKVNLDKTSCS